MVMYKTDVAVYIDEKYEEVLVDMCNKNKFEFERYDSVVRDNPEWQERYRKETGISGKVILCYITHRTTYRNGQNDILDKLEELDFDIMVNFEMS